MPPSQPRRTGGTDRGADVDALLSLTLEAHNPERNHHRRYAVSVGRDLFGHWTVRVSFGRVGQAGQEKRYGSPDECAMRAVVRQCLTRRRSAPGRLGCGYEVTDYHASAGVALADWLPLEFAALPPKA